MALLNDASLEFARAHIERFYDSDFFPKPPEYEAVWAKWNDVKAHLMSRNVAKLAVTPPRTMPAPKGTGGFRIVHQLEPLSALIYTALAHQVAGDVEAARFPADVACAYRISLDSSGFFSAGNGYDTFAQRCDELSLKNSWVLVVDIADFYNRIYLHRLNNAIEYANISLKPQADDIEGFLTRLNNKASQGIPVGPAASIIMAEAVCSDIDQFARNEGITHVRYVDDFRFFASDIITLEAFLEKLVAYLYDNHRLQVSWYKTKILASDAYRASYLKTPERVEKQELLEVVRELSDYPDQYSDADADSLASKYLTVDPPVPPSPRKGGLAGTLRSLLARTEREHKAIVRREALVRLLEKAALSAPVDLGLARRVLRTCRSLKITDVIDALFLNFKALTPVLPDVCLYLDTITTQANVPKIKPPLKALLTTAGEYTSPFVLYWLCWYASGHPGLALDVDIGRYLMTKAPIEWQARAATTTRNLAWVRSKKAELGNMGLWHRRAVLVASRIMPKDERKAWLTNFRASTEDVLDGFIVDWLLTLP